MNPFAVWIAIWLVAGQPGESAGTGAEAATHGLIAPEVSTNGWLAVDALERIVLRENLSLKAARATWEAAKERVPQARAWEDPKAGFDTVAGRFISVPPNSFTDQRLTAEQSLPLSGKNLLRAKAAEAQAAIAYAEFRRRKLDVIERARVSYYLLANAYEQLRLNDSNSELLESFVRISRAKYEAGTKPESDVLTAQTELAKLHETRTDLLRQISEAESQLNVLMNRSAQSKLPRPAPMHPFTLELELEALQRLALTNRPELLMARKKIEAAEASLAAARRAWIPDPSLRVEASRYNEASEPASEVMAGIFIDLPWLNRRKYKAAIDEAKQMKAAAQFELRAAEVETLGLVKDALQKAETFQHHVALFRDRILPLARQNVSAARSAYETDKTGFLNLLEAQRTLQEAESAYWNHVADYLSALAELEAVLGTEPQPAVHPTPHP